MTDPTHPLFGRRFPVLSISHPPQRPGHVVVAYRDFMRLRIPVQATNLAADSDARLRTQFTRDALLELLALVKECEDPCPDSPRNVWHRLPDDLKQQIIGEFTTFFKEVLHEHIRNHSADPPRSPRRRLRPPVEPAPGSGESRESETPV